jgi:2-hydroxy-4-carboxymuconate semialdehyde hemiacetal dehydrogenase
MRLCFVGYGSIAEEHAKAFVQIPGVEHACVVGRDAAATEAFAEQWGFRQWTLDLDTALAGEVDGVVITSPSDMHADQAVRSLQAGKHVLAEIPVSTNLADAERVAEAARASGKQVQVAHTQRYHPALLELRRRIACGQLHPHHLVCRWFFLRRSNYNWKGRQRTWTDNLLWHHGCHVVDAALWLLGADFFSDVRAQFGPPHAELGIPLDLDIQFRAGEQLVNVAMSYNSPWPQHDYFVIGEENGLEFRGGQLLSPEGIVHDGSGSEHSILEQDREWINAIREQRDPAVNVDAVLPAMRVLQAAQDLLG